MTRFFIYAPFVLFVFVAMFLAANWYSEARAFSARLDRLNGRQVMPGLTVSFRSKEIAGFPFRLDAVFRDLRVRIETPHGPSRWQSEQFALHRLIYENSTTLFEAAGLQFVDWTDLRGLTRSVSLRAGSLRASAIEDDAGLERFDFVGAAIEAAGLTANDLEFHLRKNPAGNSFDLYLDSNALVLPLHLPGFPSQKLHSVALSVIMRPAYALAQLQAGRVSWPVALAAFAHANGRAQVDKLEGHIGPVMTTGAGRFGLDQQSRPAGQLDLSIASQRVLSPNVTQLVFSARGGVLLANGRKIGALSPAY